MPQVRCKICARDFYAKPNWLENGWGKYCSRECQYEGQKTGITVRCFICKKAIYRTRKELRVSKSKKYFCTKTCQTLWRNKEFSGPRHGQWKGGKNVAYRKLLLKSRTERICKRCRLEDERVLVVHHLDKNPKNNTLENLTWLCNNCHYLVHQHNVSV